MNTCDRCGCELFDFYYLSYAHYKNNEEGHFYLCPECLFEIKALLNNVGKRRKVNVKSFKQGFDRETYTVSFDLPDGYDIIKGADDEKS